MREKWIWCGEKTRAKMQSYSRFSRVTFDITETARCFPTAFGHCLQWTCASTTVHNIMKEPGLPTFREPKPQGLSATKEWQERWTKNSVTCCNVAFVRFEAVGFLLLTVRLGLTVMLNVGPQEHRCGTEQTHRQPSHNALPGQLSLLPSAGRPKGRWSSATGE